MKMAKIFAHFSILDCKILRYKVLRLHTDLENILLPPIKSFRKTPAFGAYFEFLSKIFVNLEPTPIPSRREGDPDAAER
jgi:hypothetical protein